MRSTKRLNVALPIDGFRRSSLVIGVVSIESYLNEKKKRRDKKMNPKLDKDPISRKREKGNEKINENRVNEETLVIFIIDEENRLTFFSYLE